MVSWMVLLVMMLFVVLFVSVAVGGLLLLVFNHAGNMRFNHSFKFTISVSLGTFL
jgi:hypothetical protein